MAKRRQGGSSRDYPRTARLNELIREVLAGELERRDDDRVAHVAITAVDVDAELTVAQVFFDTLDASEEADDEASEALAEMAKSLRKSLAGQTQLRRTPELVFRPDPAVRAAARIDSVLDNLDEAPTTELDPEVYGAGRSGPRIEPIADTQPSAPAPDGPIVDPGGASS